MYRAILTSLPFGLLACHPAVTETTTYPRMTLSEASVDFGEVSRSGIGERTFMLANEGEMPMGVGSIGVEGGQGFHVGYDACAIECEEDGADAKGDTATGTGDDTGGDTEG